MALRPNKSVGRSQPEDQDVELEDLVAPANVQLSADGSREIPLAYVNSILQHGGFEDQWCIPPLAAAVPAINEASVRIAQTASDIGRRLATFVSREEAVTRDLTSQSSGEPSTAAASGSLDAEAGGAVPETSPDTSSTGMGTETSTGLSNVRVERPSSIFAQTSSAVMGIGQNWLISSPSFWQGCFYGDVRGFGGHTLLMQTWSCLVWSMDGAATSLKIFVSMDIARRYIFEFTGLGFAWRLAFSFLNFVLRRIERTRARWKRVVARVQTTLRGSGDDIGWLQKMPGLPPVEDGTERFHEHLERIRHGVHVLPNNLVYLLVPGLFSNHGPLYFVDTKKYFSKMGLSCYIAKIHSEAAVETNAQQLKDYIDELFWGTGKRVVLLGHSKGGVDAAAALSIYWDQLRDKVVGLVAVQSPYGGSPIASDILREGQIADIETRRIMEMVICKIIKGDMRALEDLTYQKRRQFLEKYTLPPEFPTISFHSEASKAPGVLSTMSQIAHAELPWLPGSSNTQATDEAVATKTLPVVIPLAAAMAVCALHLELRYGEKSDGLVARKDAEIPGSMVVKPERKLDHAWMVYSPAKKDDKEADSAEMCEALLSLLMEVSEERQNRALRTLLSQ